MADDKAATGVQAAEDRIRETAKWLTVSVAGIGALLAGGTQLSDLGVLDPHSDRLHLAIVTGALTVVMVALILWATVWVAATPARSVDDLVRDPPRGLGDTLKSPAYLDGEPSISALAAAYTNAIADRNQRYAASAANPSPTATNQAEAADARAVYLNQVVRNLLSVVRYRNVAFRWRVAGSVVVVGGLVAAAALGVFAWAVHPPDDVKASVATPDVLSAPKPVSVTLTGDGRAALRGALGSDCPMSGPLSALLLGKTDAGPDLLIQQRACTTTRFIAVTDWATVRQ